MITTYLLLSAAVLFSNASAEMSFNSTTDINKVVCIAPLSGSYSVLQRFNFYAILLFVVFWRKKTVLVQGAAGAVMVFSGVTAVHAFAMACFTTKHRAVFDMDIVGAWAILGPTTAFVSLMLQWSTVLRKSKARPIVQVWGLLVSVGTICSTVSIWRQYDLSYPCVDLDNNSTLTVEPSGLSGSNERFNCTPACFESRQIFRSPSELLVMNMSRVFDESFNRIVVWPGLLTTIAGTLSLFASLSEDSDKTPLQIEEEKVYRVFEARVQRDRRRRGRHAPIDPFRARRLHPKRANYFELIQAIFAYGSPLICTLSIVCNEIYFLHPPALPLGELPNAVGQWGAWVATALVLISTLVKVARADGEAIIAPATAGAAHNAGIPLTSLNPQEIHRTSIDRPEDGGQQDQGRMGMSGGVSSSTGNDAENPPAQINNNVEDGHLTVPEAMHLRHRRATTTDILRADLG